MASRGEIYSTRSDSEKRTYFFNVKENRRGDLFLNIVESSKKEEGETFERHQIMVYEEDLPSFIAELNKAAAIALKKEQIRQSELPQKFRKKPAPAAGSKNPGKPGFKPAGRSTPKPGSAAPARRPDGTSPGRPPVSKAGPKASSAKPGVKPGLKQGPKPGVKPGAKSAAVTGSSATNLQRKKVSLKLKKKRSEDGGDTPNEGQ